MGQNNITAEDNLGLVHSCAKRFKGRGIEYDDLYQAGCLGLIKAAEGFKEELGYRFSTYAVPVIIGEIKRLFRDGGAIKISRSLKELSLKVSREIQDFSLQNGYEPTVTQLSEKLNVSPEMITEAISASIPPVSLTISSDSGDCQNDIPMMPPDENVTEILSLQSEIEKLSENDKKLIQLRFYQGLTQSAAAKILGMTQVQVSRREKKILLYLRNQLS